MKVLNKTKIVLCKELSDAGVPKTHIADRLEINRDTVRLWNQGIDEFGLSGFLDKYEAAKKGPRTKRQVDPLIKIWIWQIRKREDVIMRPRLTSLDGLIFLETCMGRRFDNHSDLIQTDGGSEFKDKFRQNVHRFTDRHRVARSYKKNEQSYIESFNRSLRKECLGWEKYKQGQVAELNRIVLNYLDRYHYHRPHLGLGMRPPLGRV